MTKSRGVKQPKDMEPQHPILDRLSEQDVSRLREHLAKLPEYARKDVWEILRTAVKNLREL